MKHRHHPLRAYREAHDMTLVRLASKAGVTAATLSRIENYRLTPSLVVVARIRAATNGLVSADDFIRTEAA